MATPVWKPDTDANKLRLLAQYIDTLNFDDSNPEVQQDLYRIAEKLERLELRSRRGYYD